MNSINNNYATVVWANLIGSEDWEKQLITDNPDNVEKAVAWAKGNGYDRIEVKRINLQRAIGYWGA